MTPHISGPAILIGSLAFTFPQLEEARALHSRGWSHHQIAKALGGCGVAHVAALLGMP